MGSSFVNLKFYVMKKFYEFMIFEYVRYVSGVFVLYEN